MEFMRLEKYFLQITIVLVFILIIETLVLNYNRVGIGDFYYHAGVVNELQENPFSPKHPFYGTDDVTPYFTPYHLIVALFGNIFHLTAPEALMVFAIINMLIFILGLNLFAKYLYGEFSIIILLFILFLWRGDFGFSGEYSFRFLPRVASYHSLFAIGMMLFAYAISLKARFSNIIIVSLLSAVAIISQPISIFALSFGVPILLLKRFGSIKKAALFSLIYGITLLILLYLWPYYSLFAAAVGQAKSTSIWQNGIFPMYAPKIIIKVIWPILLLCPILFIDGVRKHSFPLLIALSIFIPYIIFAPKNSELTGRSLLFIILMIQISLAYAMSNLIRNNRKWGLILIFLSPLFLFNMAYGTYSNSKGDKSFLKPMKQEIIIISRHLKHYEVVITDINTGYYLVGHSAKIVATIFPQTFVKDDKQRIDNIARIYDPATNNLSRKNIAKKYNAQYFLINKNKIRLKRGAMFIDSNKAVVDSVRTMGNTLLELDQLLLIKIADY
ncbi:MAG: hypothetical protein JW786_00875 [Desulfobacterales bacterium]|nr:hypothetical protein [Desulfobacterales bacterium]